MMNKIVFTLALVFSIHRPATAQTAQDVQSLVDNVQTQAQQYAMSNGAANSTQQSIGQMAYKTPMTELLNTSEVKQLLSLPDLVLNAERVKLKNVILAYKNGQPVKSQVVATEYKGNEVYAKANFFPDVLEAVKASDPDKLANLERKTSVVYAFNVKTGELTKLISEVYNQALDLQQAQLASR